MRVLFSRTPAFPPEFTEAPADAVAERFAARDLTPRPDPASSPS